MSGVRIRRAELGDLDFLVELTTHEDIDPYLMALRPRDPDGVRAEIERSQREPKEFGRFVIEVQEDGGWKRAGMLGFELANRRSRIDPKKVRQLVCQGVFPPQRRNDGAPDTIPH